MRKIHVQYFGEIAEQTGKASEYLEIPKADTQKILQYLDDTYDIKGNGIQVAVNHSLVTETMVLYDTDEIAILSPFAGG